MPPRIPGPSVRPLLARIGAAAGPRTLFSVSARAQADDRLRGLQDILSPGRTQRPGQYPITSRPPSSALRPDSSNPSLLNIPPPATPLSRSSRPAGVNESSWVDPDRPFRKTSAPSSSPSFDLGTDSGPDSSPQGLMSVLQRYGTVGTVRSRTEQVRKARVMQVRQIEGQASRTWRDGDVYAPHDLSPVEMQKARAARLGQRGANMPTMNTRKKGGRDILDDLGIDPLKEYKNFAMMSEFVTELGRIKHSRDTGLRAVNQRRMAKAVRRAIGIGIMPSVHRHPELMEERVNMRKNMGS